MDFIRIWTEVDIIDIEKQIIIVDDKYGFCPGCREMGIKLENLKKCPGCEREFKYATSRDAKREVNIMNWTRKKLPHLIFVDYHDYDRLTGKKKANDLFKGI